MVSHANEFEQTNDTSWMENFDSVRWHLVTNEVKGKVDVLKEQGDGEESIKELAWGSVFEYFHPNLHLLAVGTLHKIVRVAVVHVIWPHAAKFVWGAARFLNIMLIDKGHYLHQ